LSRPHSAKGLTSVPDAAWETARRRERIVRALLQNPVAYGARSEAVAAAAAELDVTIQYFYRLIKVYEADPRTRSPLPRSPGGVADEPPCTEYRSVLSTRMNLDAGSGTGS
jgi:putative transposase